MQLDTLEIGRLTCLLKNTNSTAHLIDIIADKSYLGLLINSKGREKTKVQYMNFRYVFNLRNRRVRSRPTLSIG